MPSHLPLLLQLLLAMCCALLSGLASADMQLSSELASTPEEGAPAIEEATPLAIAPGVPAAAKPSGALATREPLPVVLRDDDPRIVTIDLTLQPDDLLQRLRNGFAMPDIDSPLVAERQAWYLNNIDYLKRVLERSRRYLYYVVSELEERGMPTELALLPIVESAYNPMAASHARALGMWQFIPSTGKNYRLEQNWWMDQRRDIIASTKAALDYLQYVYEMHGDWHLALASYNWGEGAVARAIARNEAKGLPTDYQSLSMPEETRYYVPKLQAIKNIIAQPELYGVKFDPIPNRPYFATVDNPGDMDIALAAKLAEIPLDEFIALNPAYQRPVMPSNVKSPLIIPADKVQTFIDNLGVHEAADKPLSAWKTHTLRSGEKLEKIASRYDISVAYLKQLNGITSRTRVKPGMLLLVPGKGAPRPAQFLALDAKLPDPPSPPSPATRRVCHKTKSGRTLCHTVRVSTSSKSSHAHSKASSKHKSSPKKTVKKSTKKR